MKLVDIGSSNSPTKIINLKDLKSPLGNVFKLPPDPENNLVFDPRLIDRRPYCGDRHRGWTFDIEIQDSARLVVTRTDDDHGWDVDLYFRVYDRTKEEVPAAFDSSVPYDYWGFFREYAPLDTIVVKVHRTSLDRTVTRIKDNAFYMCDKMTTCDMSNAPVTYIGWYAFNGCYSIKSILFPQGLKEIQEGAFDYCTAIDILIIPPTVTNIGCNAFYGCKNLRILKLPDDIDLDNVLGIHVTDRCYALQDKVPADQTPKQWLKHRYDPYPLHKVCYNAHVTIEEIQQCIQAHPHAAYLSDEFDMTALHMITIMACTSNIQTQSHYQDEGATGLLGCAGHITACFDGNMSAAFVPDDRGKTPLDYLLESCDGLDAHTGLVTSLCLHRSASS